MKNCWMFKSDPPCFILGGRAGDIIQMLPCFLEIHRRTSLKPTVMSSSEFVNIYDGVSYVTPYSIPENWWKMIPKAKQIAQELFGGGAVVQFWHTKPTGGDEIGADPRGFATLQCHEENHGVNMALDPDYGTSMARRCGFSREEWVGLPLVFDRRSIGREAELAKSVIGAEKRPVILYNFKARTVGFPFMPEVINPIMQRYGRHFRLVDIGNVSAHRIFDLLGLYDRAVGFITADTATAHLAVGSKVPAIWFTVPDWRGSVPRGNCVWHCKYSEILGKIEEIMQVVESWKT